MAALSFEWVLLAGLAMVLIVVVLILAAALNRWHRTAVRDSLRMFEQLDLVRIELLLMAERLDSQATAASTSEHAGNELPPTHTISGTSSSRGYELAARLARGGATGEELIRNCGLSRHEAELLLRLHSAEAARTRATDKASVQPSIKQDRRATLSVVG